MWVICGRTQTDSAKIISTEACTRATPKAIPCAFDPHKFKIIFKKFKKIIFTNPQFCTFKMIILNSWSSIVTSHKIEIQI